MDVILRLCQVIAQDTGWRGHYSPLEEYCIAWKRTSDGLEHLLLRGVSRLCAFVNQSYYYVEEQLLHRVSVELQWEVIQEVLPLHTL